MSNDDLVTTAAMEGEIPAQEVTAGEQPKEEKKEGISNREALQKAIEKHRPEVEFKKSEKTELRDKEPKKEADNEDIEPPAGFNKQEIEAWKAKDIKGIQSAFRRVHTASTQEMTRAQSAERQAREEANREKQEAQTWRELGKVGTPYLEEQEKRGITRQQAMFNMFKLIEAFQKSDPTTAKAELKALGIDLDKSPEQSSSIPKEYQEKIDALQKWKSDTESKLEQQKFQGVEEAYQTAYKNLDALKTRTGEKVFPQLMDEEYFSTEAGKLFHAELGSITKDPIFIKGVLRRFPEADFTTVLREAYIQQGGKVTGAPVTVSTNNQTDLTKKMRAAASSPGKPAARIDASSLKGKLGKRAAMAKALEIHGWEN